MTGTETAGTEMAGDGPASAALELLPAVDVAAGQAVRLVQGAAGTETDYGDPLDAALAWQHGGAQWIHLVDLDAAFGRGSNAPLLASLAGRLDIEVELSGGIRDDASLAAALATGCRRVVSAPPRWRTRPGYGASSPSTATASPSAWMCAAPGWPRAAGRPTAVSSSMCWTGWRPTAAQRYVLTDVTRDGMLAGPNLDLLREVCARTGRPVIASGGVSSLADLRAIAALRPLGVEGAIVGKALYAGAFTLAEALSAVTP